MVWNGPPDVRRWACLPSSSPSASVQAWRRRTTCSPRIDGLTDSLFSRMWQAAQRPLIPVSDAFPMPPVPRRANVRHTQVPADQRLVLPELQPSPLPLQSLSVRVTGSSSQMGAPPAAPAPRLLRSRHHQHMQLPSWLSVWPAARSAAVHQATDESLWCTAAGLRGRSGAMHLCQPIARLINPPSEEELAPRQADPPRTWPSPAVQQRVQPSPSAHCCCAHVLLLSMLASCKHDSPPPSSPSAASVSARHTLES